MVYTDKPVTEPDKLKVAQQGSHYSFLIHTKIEGIFSIKVYQNIFSFVFDDPIEKQVFL